MKRALPEGTVTFLCTDVEGSTRLLSELGDAYAAALGEHRRVLRDAFAEHRGVEVDTQGDSFFVAFARASDAVAVAEHAQSRLALPVRMGLHTGEPSVTEEGYVGLDVHVAARIGAAAHGGQVLLSQATRDLVDADVRDLGEHELRDIAGPVRLFQLGGREFPPPRTSGRARLPTPTLPLIGRKKELADMLRLVRVEQARLVTVTGPGGIGKTRFALEAARELGDDFGHEMWFVDLSSISEPDLVLPTVAAAVGSADGLAQHIGERPTLIVLDNLEQVTAAAASLAELLAVCRGLVMLGTSREPLRTAAEREYPLPTLAEAPAVELFRRRAEAARPDFDATYDELRAVCARLDWLPLAIELAAARIRLLSVSELLERLSERLPLLTSGARDAPERHRTLRAAIAWSYDLLTSDEQRLFACLSVFAGGFTIDAAQEVCRADIDGLSSVVEKSLVRRVEPRFDLLETIREFALGLLAEAPDATDIRRRHAAYFLRLGERFDHPDSTREGRWLRRELAPDADNVRAAMQWALTEPEPELALRLAGTDVYPVPPREAVRWFDAGLPLAEGLETSVRAWAFREASRVRYVLGDYRAALRLAEQSVGLYRELDDPAGLLRALRHLGNALAGVGRSEDAMGSYRESIELARALDDPFGRYRGLHGLGELERDQGNPMRATELLREAVEIALEHDDLGSGTPALHGLGDALLDLGRTDEASACYRRALTLSHEIGGARVRVFCVGALAAVAAAVGDAPRAGWLWGAVEPMEEDAGLPLVGVERKRYERLLEGVRGPVFDAAAAEGGKATVVEAVERALEELP